MLIKFFAFLMLTSNFLLLTSISFALELQSPRFKLEIGKPDIDVKNDKSIIYTIETLYGAHAFDQFKSNGYTIKTERSDKELIFSISQSLISLANISADKLKAEMELTVSTPSDLDYNISLIQEYPLKNFSGETIGLDYSLDNSYFQPMPNQNLGDFPAVIMLTKGKSFSGQAKIDFTLNPSPHQSEGTYETIIYFIAIPGY